MHQSSRSHPATHASARQPAPADRHPQASRLSRSGEVLVGDSAGLSDVELQAAALDGELYRVDVAFAPIDLVDDVTVRAALFARAVRGRPLVAERRSAAWIWGATSRAPGRHTACAAPGCRSPGPLPGVDVRETAVVSAEVTSIATPAGRVLVTDPTRTVVDMLRDGTGWGPAEQQAVTRLLSSMTVDGGVTADAPASAGRQTSLVRQTLDRDGTRPYARRALRRLHDAERAP